MATLNNLAMDLITMIASELDNDDFFNFWLVCRDLNHKSFYLFLKRYFHMRYYMLSWYSLENLLQVSCHVVFGYSLRILVICTDHLTDELLLFERSTWEYPINDTKAIINERKYKQQLDDQVYLRESSLDTIYLMQVFLNAANCRTVFVNDDH